MGMAWQPRLALGSKRQPPRFPGFFGLTFTIFTTLVMIGFRRLSAGRLAVCRHGLRVCGHGCAELSCPRVCAVFVCVCARNPRRGFWPSGWCRQRPVWSMRHSTLREQRHATSNEGGTGQGGEAVKAAETASVRVLCPPCRQADAVHLDGRRQPPRSDAGNDLPHGWAGLPGGYCQPHGRLTRLTHTPTQRS